MLAQRTSLRATHGSVRVDQEFRREEQRQAARAGRRAGQAGENEMDDVLGHVVLAVGDEDLLAEQAVGPVLRRLGAGPDRVEVRAGLRLGQVHGAGPAPGDHRSQIGVEQLAGAVGLERADRAFGEQRAERERHRGAVPDLGAGDVDKMGQAHAAERGRGRHAAPSRLGPAPVGVGEAGRRRHGAVLANRPDGVGGPVERGDLVGREAPRLGDHGRERVQVEVPLELPVDQFRQARDRLEGE